MTTKIDYIGIKCKPEKDETLRYVLKKAGNKTLYVIGLNTSTADESKPDPTVSNAMKIAESNGFDGFVMFNLYPLRSTDPSELPPTDDKNLVEKNTAAIQKELAGESHPVILAAWGNLIKTRPYLYESLKNIVKATAAQGVAWKHYGDLTKEGHPRHLSPQSLAQLEGEGKLLPFDMETYIATLK